MVMQHVLCAALLFCLVPAAATESPTSPDVETLMDSLIHSDYRVRREAVNGLARTGAAAVPALVSVLKEERDFKGVRKSLVQQDAVTALVAIGEPAIPALVETLQANGACWYAAQALGKIGPAAIQPLAVTLRDDKRHVRQAAAIALEAIGEPAIAVLRQGLADERSCADAREALADMGKPALPVMMESLSHPNHIMRLWALNAIAELKSNATPALPLLTRALGDREHSVRMAAAMAIGQVGPVAQTAVPHLIKLLNDDEPFVRGSAGAALGNIGPAASESVPALINAMKWDQRMRSVYVTSLGQIGPEAKAAIPALTELLHDEDRTVRDQAKRTLERINQTKPSRPRSRS